MNRAGPALATLLLIGIASSSVAQAGAEPLRAFEIEAGVTPDGLVVTEDRLLVSSTSFQVLVRETGGLLWSRDGKPGWTYTRPDLARGMVVVGTKGIDSGFLLSLRARGRLLALDDRTGRTIWQSKWKGWISNPLIQGSRVFAGSDRAFQALDLSSGKRLWSVETRGWSWPLLLTDTLVLFECEDRVVRAVKAADGRPVWTFSTGATGLRPVEHEGRLYIGSDDGHLHVLDLSGGTEIWSFDAGGAVTNPKIDSGTVYFGTWSNEVFALDAATGALRWRARQQCPRCDERDGFRDVEVSGDLIVTASARETVYAFDRRDGQVRWQLDVDCGYYTAIGVSEGILYVGAGQRILRFDLSNGAPQHAAKRCPE